MITSNLRKLLFNKSLPAIIVILLLSTGCQEKAEESPQKPKIQKPKINVSVISFRTMSHIIADENGKHRTIEQVNGKHEVEKGTFLLFYNHDDEEILKCDTTGKEYKRLMIENFATKPKCLWLDLSTPRKKLWAINLTQTNGLSVYSAVTRDKESNIFYGSGEGHVIEAGAKDAINVKVNGRGTGATTCMINSIKDEILVIKSRSRGPNKTLELSCHLQSW